MRDHTFKGPTLNCDVSSTSGRCSEPESALRAVLKTCSLRSSILMELGMADAFGHELPLIHPAPHVVPPSRGLGWDAERDVV